MAEQTPLDERIVMLLVNGETLSGVRIANFLDTQGPIVNEALAGLVRRGVVGVATSDADGTRLYSLLNAATIAALAYELAGVDALRETSAASIRHPGVTDRLRMTAVDVATSVWLGQQLAVAWERGATAGTHYGAEHVRGQNPTPPRNPYER